MIVPCDRCGEPSGDALCWRCASAAERADERAVLDAFRFEAARSPCPSRTPLELVELEREERGPRASLTEATAVLALQRLAGRGLVARVGWNQWSANALLVRDGCASCVEVFLAVAALRRLREHAPAVYASRARDGALLSDALMKIVEHIRELEAPEADTVDRHAERARRLLILAHDDAERAWKVT